MFVFPELLERMSDFTVTINQWDAVCEQLWGWTPAKAVAERREAALVAAMCVGSDIEDESDSDSEDEDD